MKTLTALVLSASFITTLTVGYAQASTNPTCEKYYEAAEATMMVRQKSIPLPLVLQAANGDVVLEAIAKAAYNLPVYAEKHWEQVINEFANNIYLQCVEQDL